MTPVHSDSETETIDSIDPIPSGSGVVSTVVAAATSARKWHVHKTRNNDATRYFKMTCIEQETMKIFS